MDRKQQACLIFYMWIILRSPPMLHSYLQWPPPPSLTTPRHHLHLLNQSPSTSTSTSFLSFWHNSSSFPPSYVLNFSTKSRYLKILSCLSIRQSGDHQPTTTTTSQVQQDFRVVFAAGGTGSRIIPAVAIADELKISNPNTQILFIGAPNSMESISIPSAGYPFTFIPPVRLFRPPFSLQNISFPFYLIQSTFHSFKLLQDFDPHIVIGTGGCVSLPICLAAFLKGIKIVIQEQNSVPAMENYILSLFAEVVFVAYNSTVQCFPGKHKCVVSGNPVRLSLRQFVSKDVAMSEFFPRYRGGKEEATVILVLGGSLGANAINIALLHLYGPMLMEHKNWFIIWQTGVEAFNEMESLVKNNTHLVLTPFLHSMDLAYAAADLIVSRAGAMTCSEILATGKPAILIPSPNVAEGNQLKNASLMADVAGSRVITEDELDSITLGMAIEEILGNESLMVEMSGRALQAAKPNASASIAHRILSLLESSNARK